MKISRTLLSIVPGTIRITAGRRGDYAAIARHHYRSKPPATFCVIRSAWHREGTGKRRLVAVAILSWPVPMSSARRRHFAVAPGYRAALDFANANVRTISRVVVHPQFRSLGLAARLVHQLIDRCPTRFVETSAVMGDFIGCFTAAGMDRVPTMPGEPAYFVIDKEPQQEKP